MNKQIQKFKKTSNTNLIQDSSGKSFFSQGTGNSFFSETAVHDNEHGNEFWKNNGSKRNNNTGIPEKLKTGIESLSGVDMSDVKVHRNSSRPKELDALAYTQGADIFVAPGQEKLLPHEAWHVVQQKQGRVETTKRLGKDNINDDVSLEKEATEMGNKALADNTVANLNLQSHEHSQSKNNLRGNIVQREPIPSSAIILDVNAAAEQVLQNLIATARATSRQHSTVNWRNMFLGVISQQIAGRTLGTISHAWRDNSGIDCDWTVTMNFDQTGATRTQRPTESRQITNSSGGSSANSLGSSQSNTTGSSVSATGGSSSTVGVEAGPVSASQGSSSSGTVGLNDSHTTGSSGSSGGGLSAGSSADSTESINRYIANLRVNIDCTAEAAYSNWDIINPVKWGSHLAGRQHRNYNFTIGTITYDLPNY